MRSLACFIKQISHLEYYICYIEVQGLIIKTSQSLDHKKLKISQKQLANFHHFCKNIYGLPAGGLVRFWLA